MEKISFHISAEKCSISNLFVINGSIQCILLFQLYINHDLSLELLCYAIISVNDLINLIVVFSQMKMFVTIYFRTQNIILLECKVYFEMKIKLDS